MAKYNKISKENALKYYNKLLDNYKNKDSLENKISSLKKLMEREILKEVTDISHYHPKYVNNVLKKDGQHGWLIKNQRKLINGNTKDFIPQEIVKDIERLFPWRNVAEHPENNQEVLLGNYIGLFTSVAQVIKFFSGIDIPKEIKDICNGKPEPQPPTTKDPTKTSKKKEWSGYWFVNTGIGKDKRKVRKWEFNKEYNFISAGDEDRHLKNIKKLKKGYKIFAYISENKEKKGDYGFVGYGEVEAEAVPVNEFFASKPPDKNPWKNHPDANELIVKVKWIEKFDENEAKWKKGIGLIAKQPNVYRIFDQTTVDYLEKIFGIKK